MNPTLCPAALKKAVTISILSLSCIFSIAASSIGASAMDRIERSELKAFDPVTRLEQSCDIEALNRLNVDKRMSADKVLAYAFKDPKMGKSQINAKGAAFRSRGKWYHLSYECQTQTDNMTIKSFSYKTGEVVPRDLWDQHYLVP